MWVIYVTALIVVIIVAICIFFWHFYKEKDVGKKFSKTVKSRMARKHQRCITINNGCIGLAMVFL